jgi:nucleotide-binding universal stress UspA family protein
MSTLERLLVPVDESKTSARAVDLALRIAAAFGSKIQFVHVVDLTAAVAGWASPYSAPDVGVISDGLEEQSRIALASAVARAAAAGVMSETLELRGAPADAIVEAAKSTRAEAIVVGTHGREGASRFFLGSVAECALRTAGVPVFVASPHSCAASFTRIAVALDDSDPAGAALEFAMDIARPAATLVLAHVVAAGRINATDLIDRATAKVRERGLKVETVFIEAEPIAGLLDIAHTHDIGLLVIGTHGRRGVHRLLVGSVAEGVIRECTVPVVALRAREPDVNPTALWLFNKPSQHVHMPVGS